MAAVAVVGGGPAGCAFAVTAARCGHEVVLYDEGRRLRTWPGESLPSGGGELVASVLGVEILDGHQRAYGTAAAWGSSELQTHDFMTHWAGHGWILDRDRFDASARDVAATTGVKVVHERITELPRDVEWVVDASGRAGTMVSRLDVPRIVCDSQIALVAVVPDIGGEKVTTVESAPSGWWYTTPLADDRRVVALVTDSDLVDGDRASAWRSGLADTTYIRVLAGDVRSADVGAFPSGTAYRGEMIGDGWLTVGDAAACFDPLSSQGLVTGIAMAARAATMLEGDLVGWSRDYDAVIAEHLAVRDEYLRAETRWPHEPFWARRLSPPD
ncbi:MAG: FAD-dependent oxidoreductase [Actinomycetota bacterium]